jgi:UDP-N-acetyl-D-glucosamine dehydrogenase
MSVEQPTDSISKRVQAMLADRSACVGVMGLGYVGLPLCLSFARAGFKVVGFDVDESRVAAIGRGESYIGDISDVLLQEMVATGHFSATTDMSRLAQPDAISICVPTPLRKTRDPDMSYVTSALDLIRDVLRKGQLVVLESTSYPGTTEEMLVPMVESAGFAVGQDVFIASSPERVDPGNKTWTIENTPKVVGGVTASCTQLAAELYGAIVDQVVCVSRPMAAELTKLVENTFRAVNIGLANEMALICNDLDVNSWEVLEAAATKPFGYMPFFPGPGIGGHCIPVDPLYLSWKLRAHRAQTRFIDLADEVNASMPSYVVRRIKNQLNGLKLPVNGSKILLIGVAYKKDVSDTRESPALDLLARLWELEGEVSYHDPHVSRIELGERSLESIELTQGALQDSDITVILTDHAGLDVAMIVEHAGAVFDARNLTRGHNHPKIQRL